MRSDSSLVPLVAAALLVTVSLGEALGVALEARGGPSDADWSSVVSTLRAQLKPHDGLVVGSRWIEPIARQKLGDSLLTRERLGAPVTTWPALTMVAEAGRGAVPAGYVVDERTRIGALELTRAHAASSFDVLARLEGMLHGAVASVDSDGREEPCAWSAFGAVSGNLGSGPALPSERFLCPGTFVARSIVTDTTYAAHDAVYMDVPGDGRTLVVRWTATPLGSALRGGFGLYVEAERDGKGAPITLEWRIDGRSVATLTHRDGEGWKSFEVATGARPTATGILEMRVRSPGGSRRWFGVSAAVLEAKR